VFSDLADDLGLGKLLPQATPDAKRKARSEAVQRLFKFMTKEAQIDIPANWELDNAVFVRWLTDVLSPAADRIVPLERNLNRRLWSANRYSVSDIRTRVLHTAPEEGGGGITINLVTGNEPKRGYSVAKKANERVFENVTTDEAFDEIVENYAKEFKSQLAQPEWELGLWLDSDGTLYVDTVKVFDDELDAAAFGFRERQRAMYHLDAKGPGDGLEINLLDEFADIDAYVVGRGIELPYEELLARTRKIGGVSRQVGTGAEKVIEEVFEEGGSFAVMSLDWMTPKDQKRMLDALTNRYTVSLTPEQGKANLIEVMERGLELFEDQPDLRDEMAEFYVRWRDIFIDASAETRGRPVEIRVDQIAAAASAMSPSLDASVNLATVLNMADILSRDLRMTPNMVRETKAGILKSAYGPPKAKSAEGRRLAALRRGDLDAAAKEAAYIADLEAMAATYRVGESVNLMDSRRRVRAIAGTLIAEGRTPLHVARQWLFYERSAAALLGEAEPWEILTDTKIRPFYNNIIDPADIRRTREVTIDFIMADGFFNVIGMGKVNHVTPTTTQIQAGLRPIISDTLRVLMDEGWGEQFGITTDLELQAVIWGLIRYGRRNGWWPEIETIALKKKS